MPLNAFSKNELHLWRNGEERGMNYEWVSTYLSAGIKCSCICTDMKHRFGEEIHTNRIYYGDGREERCK